MNPKVPSGTRTRSRPGRGGQTALTLLELVVVLAIVGILAALLFPVVSHARAKARTLACAATLKGLGTAYAACLLESNGYLPDAFYTFEQADSAWLVTLRESGAAQPDVLLRNERVSTLACPDSKLSIEVLAGARSGRPITMPASYGYNLGLPLLFANSSRVRQPVNTVTFYDGDPAAVLGEWRHSLGWARDSLCKRHRG